MNTQPASNAEMGHTPTPWHINEISTAGFYSALICASEENESVCIASLQDADVETDPEKTKDNAALIIKSVNSHARLLAQNEAMRKALSKIADYQWDTAATHARVTDEMQRIARAALNPPPTK